MQRGQDTVEYALLVATIAVVVLLGGAAFGEGVRRWMEAILQRLTTLPP